MIDFNRWFNRLTGLEQDDPQQQSVSPSVQAALDTMGGGQQIDAQASGDTLYRQPLATDPEARPDTATTDAAPAVTDRSADSIQPITQTYTPSPEATQPAPTGPTLSETQYGPGVDFGQSTGVIPTPVPGPSPQSIPTPVPQPVAPPVPVGPADYPDQPDLSVLTRGGVIDTTPARPVGPQEPNANDNPVTRAIDTLGSVLPNVSQETLTTVPTESGERRPLPSVQAAIEEAQGRRPELTPAERLGVAADVGGRAVTAAAEVGGGAEGFQQERRMQEIRDQAGAWDAERGGQGVGIMAVQDPRWRAANPDLAAEYDELLRQQTLRVAGSINGPDVEIARGLRAAGEAVGQTARRVVDNAADRGIPTLYHETDPQTAVHLMATANEDALVGLNVAPDPTFALGQGGKGALVEFGRPEAIGLIPNRQKPGVQMMEAAGQQAPEWTVSASGVGPRDAIRSITIQQGAPTTTLVRNVVRRIRRGDPQWADWTIEPTENGIRLVNQRVAEAERAVASGQAGRAATTAAEAAPPPAEPLPLGSRPTDTPQLRQARTDLQAAYQQETLTRMRAANPPEPTPEMQAAAEQVRQAEARVAQLEAQAGAGSTTTFGTAGFGPGTGRMYHGTAATFGRPDPGRFDPNGLFGPGYYLTSDPRVAGSYGIARASEQEPPITWATVAQSVRALAAPDGPLRRVTADRRAYLERVAHWVAGGPRTHGYSTPSALLDALSSRLSKREVAAIEREIAQRTPLPASGANVRAVEVPPGLRLLDADAPVGSEDVQTVLAQIHDPWVRQRVEAEAGAGIARGSDLYEVLRTTSQVRNAGYAQERLGQLVRALPPPSTPVPSATELLTAAGFDGIVHRGGQRVPLIDEAGNPIEHDVAVVFPASLDRLRNAFSGEVGGATLGFSPGTAAPAATGASALDRLDPALRAFNQYAGSALGTGAFGAAVGAASDPEHPEEGAARGFAAGALAGPVLSFAASRGRRGRGGALATAGFSPGERGAARGASRLPEGALPISLSTDEEVARLRLDKVPEDVRSILTQSARDADWARTQRRGVLPDEVVQTLALDDARTVEQMIRRGRAGKAYNAEETVAIRNAVASQASVVRDLSEEIAQARTAGTTPDLLIARRAAEATRLQALVQVAEGARAEAGRTLRQYRQQARLIELNPDQAIERIYRKLGGRDTGTAAVDEYTRMVNDGADPIQLAKFWAKIEQGRITVPEVFALFRRFNMLSGPRTIEVNALSGLLNTLFEVGSEGAATTLRGRPGDAVAEVMAPLGALRRAGTNLVETLRHGITLEQAARGDIPRTLSARTDNAVARGILTTMEVPDRINAAVDQAFRTIGDEWAARVVANRRARAAGLKPGNAKWPETIASTLEDIRANPEKYPDVLELSNRLTFWGDMGATGRALEAFRNTSPLVGNILIPFLRTVYKITTKSLDLSPVGVATTAQEVLRSAPGVSKLGKGAYTAGQELPKGVPPLSTRVRDNIIGTGIAFWAYDQAVRGNITGAGPDDAEKRQQLRDTGWRPYSVKIGNAYWSYANFAPFALALASGAGLAEAEQYAKKGQTDQASVFADAAKRTALVVSDMSVVAGVAAIAQSLRDPERYGAQWLTQFLQTLIPAGSALNTVGQAQDDVVRRADRDTFANQVIGGLESRLPVNPLTSDRSDVPAAQGSLGQAVPNTQQGLQALNPFRPSPETPNRTVQAFLDAGVDIGAPPKTLRGVTLSPAEQRRYQRIMGRALTEKTAPLVEEVRYLPRDQRQKRLETALREAREQAAEEILALKPGALTPGGRK